MNSLDKLSNIVDKIINGQLKIIYSDLPQDIAPLITRAAQLKREEKYGESLSYYVRAMELCNVIPSELGRMLAKTLCSMNEYEPAAIILYLCASVKWQTELTLSSPFYASNSKQQVVPSASATDFFKLLEVCKEASKGNFSPLLERTKAVSGQFNYTFCKSTTEIRRQAGNIVKAFKDF